MLKSSFRNKISDRRGYLRVDIPNLQYQSTLITLSLVYFHWCRTTLDFPSLWNTIHLREGAIHDFQLATSRLCLERSKDVPLDRHSSGVNGFPFFSRAIFDSNQECINMCRSSAHRMTFHASTLKCLRLCTAMWGSCHTPVLPSIFGGDISCDAPRRRIVLAISRALLWSPDSLGVKLTIPI